MKKAFSFCMILCFAFLALCGCTKNEEDSANLEYTAQEIDLPDAFGIIRGLASLEDQIAVASSARLGLFDLTDHSFQELDIATLSNEEMIYDIAARGNELYVLSGELPPVYTEDGERRNNPDFSGRYSITIYKNPGEPETLCTIDLGADAVLSGIVVGTNHFVCWSESTVWFIDPSNGAIQNKYNIGSTIMSLVGNEYERYLHVENGASHGFHKLNLERSELENYQSADATPVTYASSYSAGTHFFLSGETCVYRYDMDHGSSTLLFHWSDCGLGDEVITQFLQVGENEWICASRLNKKVWRLVKNELPDDRLPLHLATAVRSSELEILVKTFQQENPKYKIIIDEYASTAFDRLCTEIMAGDGPDIFDLSGFSLPLDIPYFEDLYTYIDRDPDFSREDFVPTVLSSVEIGGQLKSIPATFSIETLTVRDTDAEGKSRWTFQEMEEMLEEKGGACHLFPKWLEQKVFLEFVARVSTSSFIDWETKTAAFDTPDFREYLTFCSRLQNRDVTGLTPEEQEVWADYEEWPHLTEPERVQNLIRIGAIRINYGEPFSYIGYPCSTGDGSYFICEELQLAISVNSVEKEAAWQFVRSALKPEFQQQLAEMWNLPVRQDVLIESLNDAVALLDGFTEDEESKLLELLSKPHIFLKENQDIIYILQDETEQYFHGSASLDQTVMLIQNRVSLYLSEQSL